MQRKKIFLGLVALALLLAVALSWWWQRPGAASASAPHSGAEPSKNKAAPSPGPGGGAGVGAGGAAGGQRVPAVEATTVETVQWLDQASAVGNVRSRQSVMLRPEVSARVTAIGFRDGERVKKGQFLVQFDDQLARAQVQQARAEMNVSQSNHKRNQELVAQGFISQRALDESAAALDVAQAKLALAEATARRLRVVAPFSGIAGLKQISVGDYLKDGAGMVNLEDMDLVWVDYRLPDRLQPKVKVGQQVSLEVDALPGQRFEAVVMAVDPQLDANGRSVSVRSCVDNRALSLRPGMFARVNTVFAERASALAVPEEAIVPQGGKSFVIRLNQGERAEAPVTERVEVKLGGRQPGRVEVLQGLAAGDRVVTAGQQRLQKDGTVVRVVDMSAARNGPPAGAPGAAVSAANAGAVAAPGGPGASVASGGDAAKPNTLAARKGASAHNPCLQRGAHAAG